MNLFTFCCSVLLCVVSVWAQAAGSLTEVTVFDRTARQALTTYTRDGRIYVAGKPGNEYEIRVRNRAAGDVLAVVSVDGVNVITGETASPRQSGYVIGAGDGLSIAGWRKSLERVAAFYFTDLADSYAARTGRPDNVGVIGVALFKRKREPEVELQERDARDSAAGAAASPAPSAKSSERAQAEPPLGTGHGRSRLARARQVEFERESDEPNEIVTLHYDSYANLVAQGVIPRARDPQPFPARFVPDPPLR